jgi:hypothetical protein
MARMDGILRAISLVPRILVEDHRMYEYAGKDILWRDQISEKPAHICQYDPVSSSPSGARTAMNQIEIDAARATT